MDPKRWVPTLTLILAACANQPTEPATPPPAPALHTEPAPEPPPEPAPALHTESAPELNPGPPLEPEPDSAPPTWVPGVAFHGTYEVFEDWVSQKHLDARLGQAVGVWIAAPGEPNLAWSCTLARLGPRGAEVRGLGSGRPRSVITLAPAPPLPRGTATCFALTPGCDAADFPGSWPWGHETTTIPDLPDANHDGLPEWATTRYVYPEVEVLFGFGGSDQGRADCSVLVGG